jgi:hypothetical protein
MEYKTLCELFAIPPSTLSDTLHQAEDALYKTLHRFEPAKVRWPTFEQQREWAIRVQNKEPLVGN